MGLQLPRAQCYVGPWDWTMQQVFCVRGTPLTDKCIFVFFSFSSKPGWVPLHYDRRLLMKTSGLIVYSVRSWMTEHQKGQLTLDGLNGLEALVGFYLIHHIKGPDRLKSSTWAALLQSVSYSCLSCSSSLHSHILHDSILINCAVNSPQKCLEEHFRITQIWC